MRGAEDSVGWSLWDRPSPYIQLLFLQLKQGEESSSSAALESAWAPTPSVPAPTASPARCWGGHGAPSASLGQDRHPPRTRSFWPRQAFHISVPPPRRESTGLFWSHHLKHAPAHRTLPFPETLHLTGRKCYCNLVITDKGCLFYFSVKRSAKNSLQE